MKIAALGDGAWGTALAMLLVENGHEVHLWGPFPDYLSTMRQTRANPKFLPGVTLPEALHLEPDLARALAGAELLLLSAPSQYARGTLARLPAAGFDARRQPLVNVAKGIEIKTLKRMGEVATELLGDCQYSILSGPSHAEEVSRQVPTVVTAASLAPGLAEKVQRAFMNRRFRVYTSDDVVGVELGGSLKNVFAIAAGICDGMKLGDNPKAALLTRGIAEMARLGQALGGRPETFAGLSGIGDLMVTCFSGHSRNRHVGEELGKGQKLPTILANMGMVVAEGVSTCESAYALAQRQGVETPLMAEIHAVVHGGKDPRQALWDLMGREARPERD